MEVSDEEARKDMYLQNVIVSGSEWNAAISSLPLLPYGGIM